MRVVERIVTLCGETQLAGIPCALVRFAGCELRCSWCDTRFALDPDAGKDLGVEAIAAWARASGMRLVLLTGGEPLLQPELPELATLLCARGHRVLVETSGALDISALAPPVIRCVDIKCPGSGEVSRNRWENLGQLRDEDSVKLVLAGREDYEFAKQVIRSHGLCSPLNVLLSSVYPQLGPEQLAAWIIEDRLVDVRLNVQLHRILWPRGEASQAHSHKQEVRR